MNLSFSKFIIKCIFEFLSKPPNEIKPKNRT